MVCVTCLFMCTETGSSKTTVTLSKYKAIKIMVKLIFEELERIIWLSLIKQLQCEDDAVARILYIYRYIFDIYSVYLK